MLEFACLQQLAMDGYRTTSLQKQTIFHYNLELYRQHIQTLITACRTDYGLSQLLTVVNKPTRGSLQSGFRFFLGLF